MNLNILNTFIQVVTHRSFSKAAQFMQKSTSLVSRHIDELEQHLQIQLLIRSTRQLDLTEAGLIFYEQIRGLPKLVQNAEKNLFETQQCVTGELSIMLPTTDLLCLSPYLDRFYQQYPELQLKFRGYSIYALSQSNFSSIGPTFDICILPHYSNLFAQFAHLRLTYEFNHRFYWCAHHQYLAHTSAPQSIKQLDQHRLVTHKSQAELNNNVLYVNDATYDFDFTKAHMIMGTLMGTYGAIMDGHGIGLLPQATIDKHSDQLQKVLPQSYAISRTSYVLRQDIHNPPKKIQVFLDFIKQTLPLS